MTRKNHILIALCLLISACSPTMATRGNYLEDEQLKTIQIGVSSQDEVAKKLGTPTSVDPFDKSQWFYIGEKTATEAFFDPEIQARRVIVMKFDENGLLKSADEVDEKSGKRIEIVNKSTPAPGREMNAFEQFMDNLGKFNGSGGSLPGMNGAPGSGRGPGQ